MPKRYSDAYPDDWNRRRKKVYKRDDYKCQICGRQGGPYGNLEVQADHIKPISEGGGHDLSNLRTLCKSCHEDRHDTTTSGIRDDEMSVFMKNTVENFTSPVMWIKLLIKFNIGSIAILFYFSVTAGILHGIGFGVISSTLIVFIGTFIIYRRWYKPWYKQDDNFMKRFERW